MVRFKKIGLSGKQKAAILIASLGTDVSAEVYKYLHDDEIEQLTLEISKLDKIDNFERNAILSEFQKIVLKEKINFKDGFSYAKSVLNKAVGPEKSLSILKRLQSSFEIESFDFNFIKKLDVDNLLILLQDEHPQIIALFLTYLSPVKSAQILSKLDPELKKDVSKRVAKISNISSEVMADLEKALEKKLSIFNSKYNSLIGEDILVKILNLVDEISREAILHEIRKEDQILADRIKKKSFKFEDLIYLEDEFIKKTLTQINRTDLCKALKGVETKVQNKFFQNIPKKMVSLLKEELVLLGPLPIKEVETAQRKIIIEINRLKEMENLDQTCQKEKLVV